MLSLTSNGNYKTTTWNERNKEQISLVADLCDPAISHTLLHIGPGGILAPVAKMQVYGRGRQNIISDTAFHIVQMLESAVRKTGKFSLESFETEEVLTQLQQKGIAPIDVAIVDIEQKVLDAVKRKIGDRARYIHRDIAQSPLHEKASIVFCNNVLQRITDYKKAGHNLVEMAMPGAIIAAESDKHNVLVSDLMIELGCQIVDGDKAIYRKLL